MTPSSFPWRPSASMETLRKRAGIIKQIRDFFIQRGFMEVETPLLCQASVTDPYIQSIPAWAGPPPCEKHREKHCEKPAPYYLQTSPEYAMKRLLAAGSGPIFQMTKAFRQAEIGRFHNPEFTMIEWYQLAQDHHGLMDDMDELLQGVLNKPAAERLSYLELFQQYYGIDPHQASLETLQHCAQDKSITVACEIKDKDTWLQLLLSEHIEPRLGQDRPCFIYDFPASQAALARIQPGIVPLASRFEVYYQGIELANGFHELQEAEEQRKRFEENCALRQQLGLQEMAIDEYLLAALSKGLPDCAGVALGIDRLVMLATQSKHIADVLSFDISRA